MNAILAKYQTLPGNHTLVFSSLCNLLAEKPEKLDWSAFGPKEWHIFRKMAESEGVAPFIHYLLNDQPEVYCLAKFDSTTYRQFAYIEAITAITNEIYFTHLKTVLRDLSKHQIPVVLLKGADLAHSIYPNPALRPMSDLDLLVNEKDFKSALKLVNESGFHEYLPEVIPDFNRLISHHAHLKKESSIGVVLELHWILIATPAFRHSVSMQWFWENLEPKTEWKHIESSGNILGLNPTANMMYLSAHQIIQHGGENASLRWMLDLHRLIVCRNSEINWQQLAFQSNVFGWSSALKTALKSIEEMFGTPLPSGFYSKLDSNLNEISAMVESKSVKSSTHILTEWKKLHSLHWYGRLKFIIALVFPSTAYMRWRYKAKSDWILPFTYLKRWFIIFLDAIKTIGKFFQKDFT